MVTETDKLLFDVKDKIATITFNNPEKLNAFNQPMLHAYRERLEEARDRDDVNVIVVTGAGKGFCAGGDVGQMGASKPTPKEIKEGLWNLIQRIPLTMQTIDKPIIAAINGAAVGAGLDMALHCDMRVAVESAKLGETYVRVGLVPGNGGAYFLPRIIGLPKALELLWSAELLTAQKAKEIGLVNHVAAEGKLMEDTYAIARKIADAPPISVRYIKRLTYQCMDLDMRTALDLVSSHMTIARSSEDHAEAIRAFKEKTTGTYHNR
ncbi:crotonase/enoyl-CoA hydratase family protein [soil metagenome]